MSLWVHKIKPSKTKIQKPQRKYMIRYYKDGSEFPWRTTKPRQYIVAETFLKKPSPRHNFVVFIDGDTDNFDVSNLKWVAKSPQPKRSLTKREVAEIRWYLKKNVIKAAIKRKYNTSKTTIDKIQSGEYYKYVTYCIEPEVDDIRDYVYIREKLEPDHPWMIANRRKI